MNHLRSLRRAASVIIAAATLTLLASSCATTNKYGCPGHVNQSGRYTGR
jgi:ribosomal protein L32